MDPSRQDEFLRDLYVDSIKHPQAEPLPGMRFPDGWDETFTSMAFRIALRSKDASTQAGAVLVGKNWHILSCGFNGPPKEIVDETVPWTKRPEKYAYIIHAEENALWDAVGSQGFDSVKGSILYCTHSPCADCVLRLIKFGVKEVVIRVSTPDYPLSKYQVDPAAIMECQAYPKLAIRRI